MRFSINPPITHPPSKATPLNVPPQTAPATCDKLFKCKCTSLKEESHSNLQEGKAMDNSYKKSKPHHSFSYHVIKLDTMRSLGEDFTDVYVKR